MRTERHELNGGFSIFSNDEIEKRMQPALPDIRDVLQLYPAGHPHRLVIAANTIVIGSLAKDASLALAGWEAATDETPLAADLRNLLPTHDRPLAESSQTEWLRSQFGFVLPTRQ